MEGSPKSLFFLSGLRSEFTAFLGLSLLKGILFDGKRPFSERLKNLSITLPPFGGAVRRLFSPFAGFFSF